ncbi:uncharacterized protein LOC141856242 [Brevipalpus obovatus]|uniref:uncharacterized protein LOC141856242 n=1 Tax=Brevipalpus obovatus TaxID=246614 RepID=UPI003D9F8994
MGELSGGGNRMLTECGTNSNHSGNHEQSNDNSACCSLRKHYLHLYENEIKYDVVLLCDSSDDRQGKKALKVHRVLLSAFCTYFNELFEMDFFTKSDELCGFHHCPTVVVMKGFDYSGLKIIIDFLYRGDCVISHDQLKCVRNYAYELGIGAMIDFLDSHMHQSRSTSSSSSNNNIVAGRPLTAIKSSNHHSHRRSISHSHLHLIPSHLKTKSQVTGPSCSEDHTEIRNNNNNRRSHIIQEDEHDESQHCGDDDDDEKYSPYSHEDYIMPSSPILEPLVQLVTPCDDLNPSEFDSGSEANLSRFQDREPSAGSSLEKEPQDEGDNQMYIRTLTKAEERKLNPKNISKRTCPVCQKVFTRVDTMRSHFRGMHLQQKLLCSECTMTFKWKSHLRRHYKLFHGTDQDHSLNNNNDSNKDGKAVPA